ncbi:MAG: antitoxin [Spirochaetaceae bacterium]|nr:MAG: antitoxin [Spirochaetaceae bacterium]
MKKEFDLNRISSRQNPYAKHLKKQITIRMGVDVISYFKALSEETGIPYQNLINLYLQECVEKQKKPSLEWVS